MSLDLDMSQFVAIFVEEAHEHLANMEAQLLAISVEAATPAQFNEIFRAAHSIKGGSATFGLSNVTGIAHELDFREGGEMNRVFHEKFSQKLRNVAEWGGLQYRAISRSE